MQIIVSSASFGQWLKNKVVFAKNETITVQLIDNKIIIKDQTDTDTYSMPVEGRTDGQPIVLNATQLSALEKFLLALPEQPVTISFMHEGIVCNDFIASF